MSDSPGRVLRAREACVYVGLSRATLWRLTRDGRFPQPLQLSGPASVGWLRDELDHWLEQRAKARPTRRTASAAEAV
jgi:prophage regulatory protein